ncbi:FkbM family methyltransferase [Microbulbifer epialgicus]|uniref:FkbM family methyltransferase n=1 Tax=Microbulbifer epialgicus TaxID=393907 RepID=A0ABV4NUC5_9GAMM
MKNESKEFAYILLEKIGRAKHVVEVGAYKPEHLICLPLIFDTNCRVQLIEPNPKGIKELRKYFSNFSNIEIYECAVSDTKEKLTLIVPDITKNNPDAEASAFLGQQDSSPYRSREAHGQVEKLTPIVVAAETWDNFDDGTIDGLVVDTEGSEWTVIKQLKSRPKVICIEMEGPCGYKNPNYNKIISWMNDNDYDLYRIEKVRCLEGEVPTDYIYIRNDLK